MAMRLVCVLIIARRYDHPGFSQFSLRIIGAKARPPGYISDQEKSMNDIEKQVRVFGVPPQRLSVDQGLNLRLRGIRHSGRRVADA